MSVDCLEGLGRVSTPVLSCAFQTSAPELRSKRWSHEDGIELVSDLTVIPDALAA
jgi:hypothetical protein